jgi:hypothetical protein
MTADASLDTILDQLNRRRQRATYGAVAGLIGRPPLFLMGGRPRDARHSWVVNQETGMPSGYEPHELHPDLQSRPEIVATTESLDAWLSAHTA